MFERTEETPRQLGQCRGEVPGGGKFRVFDHGAHITEWSPGPTPVLFTSTAAEYAADKAIRGGIPVCFPWFGPGRDGRHKPAHGMARIARWHLADAVERDGVANLTWQLTRSDVDHLPGADLAPRAFEVTYRQTFGRELDCELRVRNTGPGAVAFEAALHTYFHVGDVERVHLEGLAGAEYLDKVTGTTDYQRGDVTFTGETDRVYASTADVTLVDPSLERRIVIAKRGSATTVVWNPWTDKARAMADLADHEWRHFACVETANTGNHAIHLSPGESHAMGVHIAVS